MKKFLALFLTLTLMFCCVPFGVFNITASAATSGTTGECTWTLDGTVLTISGNGKMADYTDSSAPWGGWLVTVAFIEEGVTHIGDRAFNWQTFLNTVTIPSSVKTIGQEAFSDCTALADIELPLDLEVIGNDAFYNCNKITEIIVPNKVTIIGDRAFAHCKQAARVIIGNSVTTIGEEAFKSCELVKNIVIPDSVEIIGDYSFSFNYLLENVTLGKGVKKIGASVFNGTANDFKFNITDLKSWCEIDFEFSFCNPLNIEKKLYVNGELVEDLVIPEGIETIKKNAFCYSEIRSVVLSDTVKHIEDYAFNGCEFLSQITFSDSLEKVDDAFAFCDALRDINISSLESYCNIEFSNNPYNTVSRLLLNGEEVKGDLIIPEGVERINDYAFCNRNLNSVKMPDSVKIIGEKAFYNCFELKEIDFGNGVTEIKENAFAYCNYIEELNIPDSVEIIGDNAFYNCTSIKNITFGKNIKTVGSFAFSVLLNLENFYINDLASYCNIDFLQSSNPNQYAKNLYLNGEKIEDNLVIPSSAVQIPSYAFARTDIKNVTIPDTVKSIGEYAFKDCDMLVKIKIPGSVENIGEKAFESCYDVENIELENGISVIEKAAFGNCDNVETVTVPESVVEIKGYPFVGCSLLKNIYVCENNNNYSSQEGVLFNKEKTVLIEFPAGKEKDNYVIPSSVTAINEYAFSNCYNIYEIAVPSNVKTIGMFAFYFCTHLDEISISDEIEKIGKAAFKNTGYWQNSANWNNDGLYIGKHLVEVKSGVKDFVIKKGTLTIADALFEINYNLESVEIPNSLRRISDNAFSACYNLENLKMGNGIVSIGRSAFASCQGLSEIIIPNSVKTIDDNAFNFCDELLSVTIPKSVTYIGAQAFDLCAELKTVNYGGSEEDRLNINIGAENYDLTEAEWNYNYVYELKYENGDINGDSEVNAADLALLKKILAELILLDDAEVKCTEVDEISGTPNAADLALLKKIIAELV